MDRHFLAPVAAALALLAAPALGQQQAGAAIKAASTQQYGQYLVDGQGRAVYLFTADDQGQGGAEKAESDCYDRCAEAWPPVVTRAAPQAEGAARDRLLGTIKRKDGARQVTYNGWPLYYYARDAGPGEATGQDIHSFGGEWYLIRPEGEKVGHE